MDFFNQAHADKPAGDHPDPAAASNAAHVHQDFAHAVGTRNPPALAPRLDQGPPVLTRPLASLSLSSPPPRSLPQLPFSSSSSASASASSPPSSSRRAAHPTLPSTSTSAAPEFTPLAPADLAAALNQPGALVLDIRSNASFSTARLPHAISLSVPSTLLKRPAFSLQKLSTMMRPASRARFLTWRSARSLVVYDADTSVLAEGNNVLGLLRKFRAENFTGDIAWVRGGFTAVWKEARALVVEVPLPEFSDEDGDDDKPSSPTAGLLQARNLPMSAFQQASTTTAARPLATAPSGPTQAGAAPLAFTRLLAANPFFDNIRQNVELAQGITERIRLDLPPHIVSRIASLPFKWLRDIASRDQDEQADILAMQFYKIELGEQRRLQGVMNHHTQNAFSTVREDFPYSITAGIEKGSKNRYRDIWPFEHSRVHLKGSAEDGSDYVNASFIRPLGTRRKYIATQGPLPTTYTDFWTLCWEQNVAVIVMLTRQVEGAHVKCGEYWIEERYGPMRLVPVSVEGPADEAERAVEGGAAGFNFGTQKASSPLRTPPRFSPSTNVIKRKFYLTHDEHPDRPPRLVTQLQYLGWPDVNVPESPDGLLWLINAVDRAMLEANKAANVVDEDAGPVLLHCSAGVGRTGGFIIVDAVLDATRRELRKQHRSSPPSTSSKETSDAPMDVDSARSSSPPEDNIPAQQSSASPPDVGVASAGQTKPDSRMRDPISDAVSRKLASSPSKPTVLKARLSPGRSTASSGESSSGKGSRDSSDPAFAPADSSGALSSQPGSGLFDSQEAITSASSLEPSSSPSPKKRSTDGNAASSPGRTRTAHPRRVEIVTPQGRRVPDDTYFEKVVTDSGESTHSTGGEVHSTTAFDYAAPRVLEYRESVSPPLLSSLDEPVREVLEDMRQQRMSLCQSLRQYVFVHRAIIEGVLAVVDELSEDGPFSKLPGPVPIPRPPLVGGGSGGTSIGLVKSGSLKRKQRTSPDEQDGHARDKASYAASLVRR